MPTDRNCLLHSQPQPIARQPLFTGLEADRRESPSPGDENSLWSVQFHVQCFVHWIDAIFGLTLPLPAIIGPMYFLHPNAFHLGPLHGRIGYGEAGSETHRQELVSRRMNNNCLTVQVAADRNFEALDLAGLRKMLAGR